MKKVNINVDGKDYEIDFDTLDKEEAEKMGINIHDETEGVKNPKARKFRHKFISIVPFVVLIAFFLTGFLVEGAWQWNWTLFFLIPLASSINFKSAKKLVSALLCTIILAAYFLTGFILHWWTFNWVLFFFFPIVWILCGE